ncbi:hypothetical protein N7462_007569 [Penicillium macrosclerotiorum]|uniref:uncharacterized protein n=1 Tax=Penicillium macrosclerotiorum TaxID=303699 RepID=UPI002546DCC3|nr:uncharacterized protein N7462_007569 [Penicillium macrosclerotiorum]KAJ5679325.1 hypothetical protein N7462_007569 [Penicillium macrosclerotiorum]
MIWYGLLLLCVQNVVAWHSDDDLMSFVTLPDVRAVKFDISYQDRARVSPGYWFVSPYLHIAPDKPTSLYEQFQIGPHIYDQDGHLVWSGSSMFDNRNVFDFKVINSIGDEPHISLILQYNHDGTERGFGMILDKNYEVFRKVPLREDLGYFDIHEFNVLDDGQTALVTAYLPHEVDLAELDRPEEKTFVQFGGFAEINLNTAEVVHEWSSAATIPLRESVHYHADSRVESDPGWDYVHINAVDKNENGDYLISMRFTNTLYLISAIDGHIIWRLNGRGGGDFVQDFTFSKQHDAKFLESSGTRHVISFLNNASDEEFAEEEISSALIIEVDSGTTPMTAKVLRRYNRPDGDLTRLRGNSQVLPNQNMFVCWSQGGYISEFSAEGDVLMSAQFTSSRYSNYRAYKFEFTGRPNYPPDVVSSVYGTDETNLVTTFWVSWNGATDIACWKFYAQASQFDVPVFIGNVSKLDFETMYIAKGYLDWVTAEAVDRDGNVLGKSTVHRTQFPNWESSGWSGYSGLPRPQNPKSIYKADGTLLQDSVIGNADLDASLSDTTEAQVRKATQTLINTYEAIRSIGGIFALVLLLAVMSGIMASYLLIRGWRVRLYQRIPMEDGIPEEEARLHPSMED